MPENQNKTLTIEKFNRYLESNGCRKTPERFAILHEILEIDKHFTAEMLGDRMSNSEYKVSKTTIYSNLDLLVECGILMRSALAGGCMYELAEGKHEHLHLVCNECGKVKDVKDLDLMRYLNTRKYSAFNAEKFEFTVYGTCTNCARKIKRRGKPKE